MLPTARGFDHFIGFLNGQNYYWSKKYPLESQYTDFMYSDSDCYSAYNFSDMSTYSSVLYRDKAVQAINAHDFSTNPMFMYLAVQAVHDPFNDLDAEFSDGIPASYLDSSMYTHIRDTIVGRSRQQYAMALYILDSSVKTVVEAMAARDQMQNTYVIFASDNGGCYQAGGRNGELRGSKGSLFEGGVKVDSFIYSPLLPDSSKGSVYSGIMHVSDWFPTILELSDTKGCLPPDFTSTFSIPPAQVLNPLSTSGLMGTATLAPCCPRSRPVRGSTCCTTCT
jgi:arylsulfatase A-like enzyme